jgi:mRNA interferase MazF
MSKKYIPDQGDIIYITLDPSLGHEQKGRRPAVVLSSIKYNQLTELCLVVPITSKTKGYPFETDIGSDHKIKGYALADQIKTMSWVERKAEFVEKVKEEILIDVCAKIKSLLK